MTTFNSLADVEAFSTSLFKAMDDLTEVIEAETDLVRAGKLVGATALQAQKAKHAETYVALVQKAKNQGSTIKALSPQWAEKLIKTQDTFKATLQINMAALSTARDLSQNLMRGVAENMAKSEKTTTYSASGSAPNTYAEPAKGIAVNRSL